jgi:hypothetical protein
MSKVPGALERKKQQELFKNRLLGEESKLAGPLAQAKLNYMQRHGVPHEQLLSNFIHGSDTQESKDFARFLAQGKVNPSEITAAEYLKGAGTPESKQLAEQMFLNKNTKLGKGANQPQILKLMEKRNELALEKGENDPEVQAIDDVISKQRGTAATGTTRTRLQQADLANIQRKYLSSNEQPYYGEGSIRNVRRDINRYKVTKDPDEKKRLFEKLTKSGAAVKILPEYAVTQLLGMGSGKPSEAAIMRQEKALSMGWPETLQFEMNNVPSEIIEGINKRHNQYQSDLTNLATKKVEKGFREYGLSNEDKEMIEIKNKNTGETKMVTKEEAQKLGAI